MANAHPKPSEHEPTPAPDGQEDDLPYKAEDPPAYIWTHRAAELRDQGRIVASATLVNGVLGTTVAGPCPRCGHRFVDQQVSHAVVGHPGVLGDEVDAGSVADVERVVVTCDCRRTHRGRPSGAKPQGCGISYAVLAEVDEP
jgi:hypothetical protein